jgi:hypothetical protein
MTGLGYTNEVPIGKLVRDIRFVSVVRATTSCEQVHGRYVIPVLRRT